MDSDHVILPPPSAKNPIPALPAALRIDNKERFLEVLKANPCLDESQDFRQLLVFGKESLRTLLMRQVLQDPHTRTFGNSKSSSSKNNNNKSKSNKNWDDSRIFPLPKGLQNNIVGTKVLLKKKNSTSAVSTTSTSTSTTTLGPQRTRTTWKGLGTTNEETGGGESSSSVDDLASEDDKDLFTSPDDLFEHVDVVTYIIRPWDLDQTMAVVSRIKGCALKGQQQPSGRTHKQHHRIVFVPSVTAMCTKILVDHKVWNPNATAATTTTSTTQSSDVSVCSLQLDVFPMESDVLSLEYEEGLKDAGNVGGCPSIMIETTARALSKLQDVVGTIPRIQSLGTWGEDVLEKLLNTTVDDYWAEQKYSPHDQTETASGWDDGGMQDDNASEAKQYIDDTASSGLAMVLMDRRLDMVTPMITPLTYEGLLDEMVGIDCGHLELPEDIINPDNDEDGEEEESKSSSNNPFDDTPSTNPFGGAASTSTKPKPNVSLGVHEGDTLYAEVRDQHVEKFGSFLQDQAKALIETKANFTSKETKKDLDEIQNFVKQLPVFVQNSRSLSNHIHLAEFIKAQTVDVSFRDQWSTERAMIEGEYCYDFLEECIFQDHNPYKVLRLICLQSLVSGGIRANRYEQLRQFIVQVYGFEFLPVLHDLENMGWIKKMEGNLATNFVTGDASRSLFQNLRRNLILIHAEVNTMEPDDVSYVSSGYAPLTVRLIQSAMQGWSDKEDVLRDVFSMMAFSSDTQPSRLLDVIQSNPPRDLPTTLRHQQTKPLKTSLGAYGRNQGGSKPTLIAVYLGGITYAEIASLRFLSKKDTFPYHIIIVTTKILNGSKLLQQMGQ